MLRTDATAGHATDPPRSLHFSHSSGKIGAPPVVWWERGQPSGREMTMEEIRTQARLVDLSASGFVAGGLSTIVPREEIAEAIERGEYPAPLVLDITRIEGQRGDDVSAHARVVVDWNEATLKELLQSTSDDDVTLWFDSNELERALEEGEVDAHGMREKTALLAVAVAAAGATAGGAFAHTLAGSSGAMGAAATPSSVSDVASSDAVARYEANVAADQSDALSRYEANVASSESATPATSGFVSDVANSDAVARYQANLAADQSDALSRYEANVGSNVAASSSDTSAASSGDGASLPSTAEEVGIAAGVALLISAAGFTLARSRTPPARPA
jgi:hypothetical protein